MRAMVTLGMVSPPERVPRGFDLVELQCEKSVPKKTAQLPKAKYTVHAPYYGTIATDKEQKAKDARMRIIDASSFARKVGGKLVVARAGFYAKKKPGDVFEIVKKNCKDLKRSMSIPLGIETQPRQSQFGSLNEVLRLAKEAKIVPVLNLSAIKDREGKINLGEVLNKVKSPYCHYNSRVDLETLAYVAKKIDDITLVAEDEKAADSLSKVL
jgi:endonuclease IV